MSKASQEQVIVQLHNEKFKIEIKHIKQSKEKREWWVNLDEFLLRIN